MSTSISNKEKLINYLLDNNICNNHATAEKMVNLYLSRKQNKPAKVVYQITYSGPEQTIYYDLFESQEGAGMLVKKTQ